jgi:hypothetical protein
MTRIRSLISSSARAGRLFARRLSIGMLPGAVASEQASDRVLGFGQFLLAAPQGGLEAGQLSLQIRAFSGIRVLADVCASRWPYVDQAFGREQPDGGLSCVLGDVMYIPELPVRRHPGTWRVRPVPDLGPEGIREAPAGEAVGAWWGHSASIADCLKTALDVAQMRNYRLKSVANRLKTVIRTVPLRGDSQQ